MLVPCQPIEQQRLPEDEFIEAWQPLRIGHEAVGPRLGGDLIAGVFDELLEVDVRALVFERVPFELEILLEEVAVANQAQLARELPVACNVLSMARQHAATKRIGHFEIPPASAQVV